MTGITPPFLVGRFGAGSRGELRGIPRGVVGEPPTQRGGDAAAKLERTKEAGGQVVSAGAAGDGEGHGREIRPVRP